MKIKILFCVLMGAMLTSCSSTYSYFTKDLYENEHWTQDDIMRIQFYVSKDIVLSRTVQDGETAIQGGKISIKNGQRIEQVVIKAYTPGVLILMPNTDRFAISFEESDNESYLMFGPNPNYNNRFALLAQDWERENGQVHYRDKLYDVDASSAYASLMVDLKREGDNQYTTHQAKGRTLKGS